MNKYKKNDELCTKILTIQQLNDWSQKKTAEKLGVTPRFLRYVLKGQRNITRRTVKGRKTLRNIKYQYTISKRYRFSLGLALVHESDVVRGSVVVSKSRDYINKKFRKMTNIVTKNIYSFADMKTDYDDVIRLLAENETVNASELLSEIKHFKRWGGQ